MRLIIICPLCGMWVDPSRFSVLRWPLRMFRRIMGGRHPHSKRGKIRFEDTEVPGELQTLMVSRLQDLASKFGYELKPRLDARGMRTFESPARREYTFEFKGVRE